MCTATFYPTADSGFIFTSNRDEAPGRETIAPLTYTEEGQQVFYPKDALAGGTWIAVNKGLGRSLCLLNGGLEPHLPGGTYARSRGLVVKETLTSKGGLQAVTKEDLKGVEPFTLIQIENKDKPSLQQLIWTGKEALKDELPWEPRVWSSTLLYTPAIKEAREAWFEDWLGEFPEQDPKSLLRFHHEAGTGDPQNDLIMDRHFVKTKSISQIEVHDSVYGFRYEDLGTGLITTDRI